jgi:hypothetical protein
MKELLDTLIQDARVWQAKAHVQGSRTTEPTGFEALDQQLKGTGWPIGALTECLLEGAGIGELQLLLPLMRHQIAAGKTLFWINPPHTPYAPALQREGLDLSRVVVIQTEDQTDALWSLENCLRSSVTGLVLAWPGALKQRQIRRLQLAAETGGSLCVLFRPAQAANESSPAALRLQLTPQDHRTLKVEVLKRRGGWAADTCTLTLPDHSLPFASKAVSRVVHGPWSESGGS